MKNEIWSPDWIAKEPQLASNLITELQRMIEELESKQKYAAVKIAKLEEQNKAFKITIKQMDRRIMKGMAS
jgi:hypothetical protein